jgi:hypothetical protein
MDPSAASAAAVASIDHALSAQAATMSYNDAFLLIGVLFVLASPAVLLLKRRIPGAAAGRAHP